MSGLYRLLDEDGALPQCEQCFPTGSSKPIDIHIADDGPVGFSVTKTWAHKPFEETRLPVGVPMQGMLLSGPIGSLYRGRGLVCDRCLSL